MDKVVPEVYLKHWTLMTLLLTATRGFGSAAAGVRFGVLWGLWRLGVLGNTVFTELLLLKAAAG